jgi:uncharacterized protein (TIGR00251 family)
LELSLHVQPNASKTGFAGMHGESLKLRVRARPVEGAANLAIREFIAQFAGVSKSQVELLQGETSREKRLRITLAPGAKAGELEDLERRLREAAG